MVLDGLKITDGREALLDKALSLYPPIRSQSQWEFGWYRTAASMKGDAKLNASITEERQRRVKSGETVPPKGELPIASASPALRS
jgi:hypothetical protein